jgi:glycosyltransferase involved in cell wall biosynthesis
VTRRLRVAITLEQCWHRVPGGTARATIESTRALADRGSLDIVGVSARHRPPPPTEWAPPVEVRRLALPRVALYESWHYLRRPRVQSATGHVDVIHATGMAMPPRSAPLVVTVHDLGFMHEPGHVTRHGLRFFRRAIELARREADLVVAPSRSTIDDCVAHGFDPDRLRLVPWGVDPAAVDQAEVAAVRRRHRLERPYVLFVGTIEPRKNLSSLLTAFHRAHLEGVDLVLVGPEGWNEDLGRLVAPVRKRVRALGFVPAAELPALYAGASVFCLPSLREGFGLPVLEAMAQGTPVVTSAGTATAEVAGDAALLVDPADTGSLADSLARVIDDGRLAAELGNRGRERSRLYTWDRTATLLEAAYREVAQ